MVHGSEYVVEGVNAPKVIDDIGHADMGRNGFPLLAATVSSGWRRADCPLMKSTRASVLRAAVKRYPARPVFLVVRMRPATQEESAASADRAAGAKGNHENAAEVSVEAQKQSASLIAGPTVLTAPLCEPGGGTVRCQVMIDTEGKTAELRTGMQLTEVVPWSEFRYRLLAQFRPSRESKDLGGGLL
jgi:hypothetical protein